MRGHRRLPGGGRAMVRDGVVGDALTVDIVLSLFCDRHVRRPSLEWRRITKTIILLRSLADVNRNGATAGPRTSAVRDPRPKNVSLGEKRVIRLQHHHRHEHQHQYRRQDDRIDQRQPLPGHVHEDGDDQPGLQHHEDQDQRPSQISLQTDIVDHVGAGAEDEQPCPDHEIELDRMLLMGIRVRNRLPAVMRMPAAACCPCVYRCFSHVCLSPQIKECEDEHPDQIDEMPVETHDLDAFVVALAAREKAAAPKS